MWMQGSTHRKRHEGGQDAKKGHKKEKSAALEEPDSPKVSDKPTFR